jgi:hypothetical protein
MKRYDPYKANKMLKEFLQEEKIDYYMDRYMPEHMRHNNKITE